jgi:purine-binding chemotaxis protein CheW
LFGLGRRAEGEGLRLVLLRSGGMEFGVVAEGIGELRRVGEAGLERSLPTLGGAGETYLRGVTEDRLVVLDGARLLGDGSLVVHEGERI